MALLQFFKAILGLWMYVNIASSPDNIVSAMCLLCYCRSLAVDIFHRYEGHWNQVFVAPYLEDSDCYISMHMKAKYVLTTYWLGFNVRINSD